MARARARTKFRKVEVPEHVRTADSREGSLLASSVATMRSHEQRRGSPIMVPPSVKVRGMHRLGVKDLMELRVDTSYQRDEVTQEVNDLIVVLKRGGVIPDPISVAERRYGDHGRYIVDGQQRWWAHVDCGVPIHAVLYEVQTYDDEVRLFHALNTQTRVTPETRLRSLPGAAGDTIRRLNTEGPLKGHVKFTAGSNSIVGAMILLRSLTALISNTKGIGGVDRVAPTFDRYYKMAPKIAGRMIDQYAELAARIFVEPRKRMRSVPGVALARIGYAAWTADPANMPMPSDRQVRRLQALDWDGLTPSSAAKWQPTVIAAIQEIWPVPLVQENKA
jgi:hypothetical protein